MIIFLGDNETNGGNLAKAKDVNNEVENGF